MSLPLALTGLWFVAQLVAVHAGCQRGEVGFDVPSSPPHRMTGTAAMPFAATRSTSGRRDRRAQRAPEDGWGGPVAPHVNNSYGAIQMSYTTNPGAGMHMLTPWNFGLLDAIIETSEAINAEMCGISINSLPAPKAVWHSDPLDVSDAEIEEVIRLGLDASTAKLQPMVTNGSLVALGGGTCGKAIAQLICARSLDYAHLGYVNDCSARHLNQSLYWPSGVFIFTFSRAKRQALLDWLVRWRTDLHRPQQSSFIGLLGWGNGGGWNMTVVPCSEVPDKFM